MSARKNPRLNPDPPEVTPWLPSPKKRRTATSVEVADGEPVEPAAAVAPQAAVVIPPAQAAAVNPPPAAVVPPAADVVQPALALEMAGSSTVLLSDYMKQVKVSEALNQVLSGLQQKVDVYKAQQNSSDMKLQTLQAQLFALNELTVITGDDFEALGLLKKAGYKGKINFP